jgi:hypothetical protein
LVGSFDEDSVGEGRVQAARRQRDHQQRGRRGLAVGAGYPDAPAVFQRGGPAQDQLAALPRGDELLLPGVDGSREDERVGVVEVPRGVADDDVAAERLVMINVREK